MSEHQPTTWVSFFFDLHILVCTFPAGLWFCIKNINDERVFGKRKYFLNILKNFAFNLILLWFSLLKADMWRVLKNGLKVMCLKVVIKSCLHPGVFKTVYRNAEVVEMVMECSPRRWDPVICCVQFCDWSFVFWQGTVPLQVSQENSSVQRQGPYSGRLALIPSQMIQNAFAFQVFCSFSEQNHLLWNKC